MGPTGAAEVRSCGSRCADWFGCGVSPDGTIDRIRGDDWRRDLQKRTSARESQFQSS